MGVMASPPEAHNTARGDVYGQLLQVRDIHGGVTLNAPPQAPAPATDVSLDPPRTATTVRGRDELLTVLRTAMERGAPVPHVLTGPGGFGKTTVAAALAEHARAEGRTVFWVRPDAILPSMLEVAVELGGTRQEAEQFKTAPRQAARWVWRHLDSAPRPWLLVIDNADRPEELDPENRPGEQRGWMRSSPGGFVLVTSRVDDPTLWAPAQVHRVEVLGEGDSATALTDHAGLTELTGAAPLAERLGGVPLALSLAGRILATHQVLFPDANALLAHLENDISRLDQLTVAPTKADNSARRTLSGVWNLSLDMVGQQNPRAVPLLKILAFLGTGGQEIPLRRIPVPVLRGGALGTAGTPLNEVLLVQAVNALVVHGLVTIGRTKGEPVLRLHPLVAETTLNGLTEEDVPLLDEVESVLVHQREHDPLLELNCYLALISAQERLSPEYGRPSKGRAGSAAETRATRHGEVLRLLSVTGQRDEAARMGVRVVADAEKAFGPAHEIPLRLRHQLAEVGLEQGGVDQADADFRELLELNTTHHGPEHDNTLDARFMLALIALRREDWAEASAGFRTVREIGERINGAESQPVLLARTNLAYAIMRQGDPATAEREFTAVRAVQARVSGEHHRMTGQADFYLGRAVFETGDHARAREPFARCVSVWERALGMDHPDARTARTWLERVGGSTTPSE